MDKVLIAILQDNKHFVSRLLLIHKGTLLEEQCFEQLLIISKAMVEYFIFTHRQLHLDGPFLKLIPKFKFILNLYYSKII